MINDSIQKDLVDVLHQSDAKKRGVVYAAIGTIFAGLYVKSNDYDAIRKGESKIKTKAMAYKLNELAIIDKDALYKSMMNAVDFRCWSYASDLSNVLASKSFMDITLVNQYYSQALIDDINENMDLYKSAALKFSQWVIPTLED